MAAVRSALIIANDEYQDPKLRRLRAPSQDAEELGRVLSDPGIGDFEVEVSTNEPEHVVRRKIAAFFADRRRDDLLLLHISSHGLKDDSGRLYFAASDTEVDHLDATAVWAEFVNRQMTGSRSQRIVLLLDCCYSGAFARGMTARAGDAVEVRERFEGSGRAVLTASSAMEYSFEGDELSGEGNPSVFTSAVVKALETGEADRDGDHLISVDELYDYVHDQVREITPKQTPGKWVFDLRGDLYIAKSRYAGGEPRELPAELEAASESPLAYVREGAVHELGRLLRGGHAGVAEAARVVLQRLVEDDSRRVSDAAKTTLASAAPPAAPVDEPRRRFSSAVRATLSRPPAPPARRRPARVVAALLALALAAAVLGIAGVFGGRDGAALPTGVAPVLGPLPSPFALAVGAGSLWVADRDGSAIRRVDPRSRKVEGKPIAVGEDPTGIAVADGAVWVVNDTAGTVSKIDAASGKVVGNAISIPDTHDGDTIAAGEGKVWVANLRGGIVPINAADGKREPAIALPGGAKAIEVAFGKGALWILTRDGTVMRLDPASREPGNPVKVAGRLTPDTGELAVGEGAVWVAALDAETVFRVDPLKRTVVPIRFAEGIDGDIAAGAGYVWTIDGARRLVRIDPDNHNARSRSAATFAPTYSGNTNDLTTGDGALWIADLGRNRVIRVVP